MKEKEYILAIDQGTTGSRAIVYSKQGQQVASAYQEFRQYFPKPGWVEHDAEEIWMSVRATIERVLRKVPCSKIAAIGITNQRETTVVWDRRTGKPVHKAICWQCRRTSARCDQLKRKHRALFKKRTGLPVDAYFSATKIEWILNHVKGARAQARKGELLFGTTDSWILWKLTGGQVHATDYTNASRTLIFNIEKRQWDPLLLKKFRIPASMLPEVKRSSGIFGYTVRLGRLRAGIPLSGVAGDQQAALFGQACFSPGTLKNTYGTGAFVLMNTGSKRVLSQHGLISTLCCDGAGDPAYALEGSIFIAGAAVQWLRDGLGIIQTAQETEARALAVKANDGVYFVPAFVGLGAPYWDQEARGTIVGLTRGIDRNHIIRAALEAMAYQTQDVLLAMQKESGLKPRSLKVDGGAVVNNFLCQFQADLTGLRIIRPQIIETTSLGAAYLAGLAVGYYKNAKEIQKFREVQKTFIRRIKAPEAHALYRGWQKAVRLARA